jgi:ribonucleoside-diphosphate reductase alpha subunit
MESQGNSINNGGSSLENISAEIDENEVMHVIKRTGKKEKLNPNEITRRIQQLINQHPKIPHVNASKIMIKVVQGIRDNIKTSEIDEFAANVAESLSISNPNYLKLAARIAIDNHQKNTDRSFRDKMRKAYLRKDVDGTVVPMVSEEFMGYVELHQNTIEEMIDYKRDFLFDFFGFRTFQTLYGFRIGGQIIERPQDVFMRVAIQLHMNSYSLGGGDDDPSVAEEEKSIHEEFDMIKATYNTLSLKYYTHATPTYFNAGTCRPQMASCYLMGLDDSCEGIMNCAKDMAMISKWAGGIGVHIHNIRCEGSEIRGTNGVSGGILPWAKIFNATMRGFNQGGKRLGSCALYLMPHHPDIMTFLKLRLPGGSDLERARDLFYALWIPNIFMERVISGEKWSLFDPNRCGDLSELYDDNEKKYTQRYLELEKKGMYKAQISAREIWDAIYESNKQTGIPYICFSDWVNSMSNHKNLGTVKSSNLCTEIMLYSSPSEYAVCNLSSICLPNFVVDDAGVDSEFPEKPRFDFAKLAEVVCLIVTNLNRVIDRNYYPVEQTRTSNMKHRPIGIGIQGLADCYLKMRFAYDSPDARSLNRKISEVIYYAAVSQSTKICRTMYMKARNDIASRGYTFIDRIVDGKVQRVRVESVEKTDFAYPSMSLNGGSPISHGVFHWEMAGLAVGELSHMSDWESVRSHIKLYGVRNSMLVALMPTATTSQLMGNCECFEPYTSNIYKRKTLAGEHVVINKYLMNDLYKLKIWNETLQEYLMLFDGSIQFIDGIPDDIKGLYKTAYEIDQMELIRQAADRQPFVDQAQSLNYYIRDMNKENFSRLLFAAWRSKLKTGKYYTRTTAAMNPQKFSLDPKLIEEMQKAVEERKKTMVGGVKETAPEEEICLVCSS